jgi:hypothetical protein
MKNFDLEKIKKITPQMLGDGFIVFWNRFFKLFLTVFFLGMTAWGGYLWYFNLYRAQWTDLEKKTFLDSQSKNTEFKKETLEKVVRNIEAGREKFSREIFSGKNIFKSY